MRARRRADRSALVTEKRKQDRRKLRPDKRIHNAVVATTNAKADAAPPPITGVVVRKVKVGRLRTVAHWRREVGRVYRQMRRGEIPAELGTKLAFVARLGLDAAKNEEEVEQLKILNARYQALLTGTPLPALPAPAAVDQP